ncbi:MAG TPA: sugar transferase [Terriglobia bacterium]|jgi:lipopolysaccharide/colanic/teichoic acid biosynthesis glycosyltransferase|nr:sugar transferase [Terriglobia bacterium]
MIIKSDSQPSRRKTGSSAPPLGKLKKDIAPEEWFTRILTLERKRAERSQKLFLLMLLDGGSLFQADSREDVLRKLVSALCESTRETDVMGWYRENATLGVIFTEMGSGDKASFLPPLFTKLSGALSRSLEVEQLNQIHVSFHFFPEYWDNMKPRRLSDLILYPDLRHQIALRKGANMIKRAMDILGSSLALIFLSPLLAVIAVLIKLTSEGPVIFAQERVGQYGVRFKFFKFRSMYSESDHGIHAEFVKRFINGVAGDSGAEEKQNGVYKLTADPRVTPIGRFLRKTSLDELPQFWNVLKGDMSLVGPRPPIPYEVESYEIWHWRRFLEAKPGITGLWQVYGRSRTTFDEMVRLDLRYAQSRSLWLDLRILLQTPRAVFNGTGAY